jgi:hypothetical protein
MDDAPMTLLTILIWQLISLVFVALSCFAFVVLVVMQNDAPKESTHIKSKPAAYLLINGG